MSYLDSQRRVGLDWHRLEHALIIVICCFVILAALLSLPEIFPKLRSGLSEGCLLEGVIQKLTHLAWLGLLVILIVSLLLPEILPPGE